MSVNLSLLGGAGWQFFTDNGTPLAGGLLYTYLAGTSTAATTYTTSAGNVPNSNPIVLNSAGRVQTEIWLTQGVSYKFVLKTSAFITIGTYDNIPGANDISQFIAPTGSSLIGYLPAVPGAVATTVQAKLRQYVSVKDFGAVGNGIADDTAAIQAAVNNGGAVFFPLGTYKVTSTITISNPISLYSDGTGYTYNPNYGTGQSGATINCFGITGYLFNVVLGLDTDVAGPYIKGFMFYGDSSSTWLGVLKATPNASSASSAVQQAIMEDCGFSGSTAAAGAMINYSSFDRAKFVRCAFSAISGRAFYNTFLTGGSITTLIELDQCVFAYCRQIISVYATTKIQFDSCSFEASTVVGALANTVADFNSCYFESIGQTWGGYTTGIENKDLGFSGGAVLQTPITSAINTIGSENTFVSCTFNYRNAAHVALYPTSANVYPVGIPTGVYTGCSVNFIGARILDNNSGTSFFETQVDAQQNLVNYSWMSGIFSPEKLSATDIRKLTTGNLYVDFTGTNPSQPTMVDVRNGQFILSGTSFSTSLGFPGGNPTGDTWKVGDRIYYASPAPSAANGSQGIGAVCVAAGSPGTWVVFGTLDSGTLTNVTTATYAVLITDTNLIVNFAGTCTVTLPNPAFAFRRLTFRTIQNQGVNSSGLNVTSLAGVAGGSTILTNTAGRWATIISDGTAWQIQQAN